MFPWGRAYFLAPTMLGQGPAVIPSMKKPVHRALLLEDAVNALQEMERTFAELESSDIFRAFTSRQKRPTAIHSPDCAA